MFGPPGHVQSLASGGRLGPLSGVIPRAIVDVFDQIRALTAPGPGRGVPPPPVVTVYCSFVQIYNEQVFDMLRDGGRARPLEVPPPLPFHVLASSRDFSFLGRITPTILPL